MLTVTPRTVRAGACRVMPWKNGRGTTTELAVEPPEASLDRFDCRVSIAELRGPGSFSPFPGYDRIIVQLDGAPMALTHGGRPPIVLEQLVPHAFSGDDATMCTVDGVAHDFNLIVRRGAARPALSVHRLVEGGTLEIDSDTASVIHVLAGALTCVGGAQLPAGDTRVEGVGNRSEYHGRFGALVIQATLSYPHAPLTPVGLQG